ncbi:DUF1642 domain-containing protein [Lactiplantibacillus plantarum]|uniref:DUF1642 domain-containing protein n=1 Tax=Lactiplantibacillus plantarum TaxID=1590 RepID=UPI00374D0AA8
MTEIYRKTATIRAEQFDGSDKMVKKYNITPPMPLDPDYTINTLEGDMVLGVGDWVATGIKGEHWAIADDVFKKTYADLPVIPDYVAKYINYRKSNHCNILDVMNDYFREDRVDKYIERNSNVFARAWLDGYTVEE